MKRRAWVAAILALGACAAPPQDVVTRDEVREMVRQSLAAELVRSAGERTERVYDAWVKQAFEDYRRALAKTPEVPDRVRIAGIEERAAEVLDRAELPPPGATLDVSALRKGLARLRRCMEAHVANITNADTPAYKAVRRHHHGDGVARSWEPGKLKNTDRHLDLAIEGDGLFRVQLPGGLIAYTRAGDFQVDAEGNLATDEGYPSDPQFTIPEDTIGVTVDVVGRVFVVTVSDPQTPTEIGQFQLARFVDPSALESIGDDLYLPTPASGEPIDGQPGDRNQGFGVIRQGFLEESNVDVLSETLDLSLDSLALEILVEIFEKFNKSRNGAAQY
jgi:flagellar basal body rod protein FlgG